MDDSKMKKAKEFLELWRETVKTHQENMVFSQEMSEKTLKTYQNISLNPKDQKLPQYLVQLSHRQYLELMTMVEDGGYEDIFEALSSLFSNCLAKKKG